MISTRHLEGLPGIVDLKRLSQSLAMLDAILSPEWLYRYHSFNAHWASDIQMASMRDGSGDEYYLVFTKAGAILKGFAHESTMSSYRSNPPAPWPGVLDQIPPQLRIFLEEPAFALDEVSFCIRRAAVDDRWEVGQIDFPHGNDPDGSAHLLSILDCDPHTYEAFAEDYFAEESEPRTYSLDHIERIYKHEALTEDLVQALNPQVRLADVLPDAQEIGYPAGR